MALRPVALFIQAPAQDPPVPALDSMIMMAAAVGAVYIARRSCDCTESLAPSTNVQTRLDLATTRRPTLTMRL